VEVNQTLRDLWLSTIYTFLGGFCSITEVCQLRNSLGTEVLRSPILAALLHGTPAAAISQTAMWGIAEGATYIRLGGHHDGYWPTF